MTTDKSTWAAALNRAPVGTVVMDRDGDIWKKHFTTDDPNDGWLRRGGGWAGPIEMVDYGPFQLWAE